MKNHYICDVYQYVKYQPIMKKEKREIEIASVKLQEDIDKKEATRQWLQRSWSYRSIYYLKKYLDDLYIDSIVGFIFPGAGDVLSAIMSVPSIYVAIVKIKSLPLTLAIIYNILVDCCVGMLPFYIGDVFDIFVRANKKNFNLIMGFVENDKKIIKEVNRKAIYMGIMILLLCVAIYFMILFVKWQWELMMSFWQWIGGLF